MKNIYIFFLFSFFSCGMFAQVKTIKVRNADTTCVAFIEGVQGDSISLEKLKTLDKVEMNGEGCECETVEIEVIMAGKRGTKIYNITGNQLTEEIKSELRLIPAGSQIWFEIKLHTKKTRKLPTVKLKVI